jgi:hypothetical protein
MSTESAPTGGAAQPGSQLTELGFRPPGRDELAAEPPDRRHMPRRRRGDHGPSLRLSGDPPLPARQQREVTVGGDRPFVGRRDEHEWRLPAEADGAVDRVPG